MDCRRNQRPGCARSCRAALAGLAALLTTGALLFDARARPQPPAAMPRSATRTAGAKTRVDRQDLDVRLPLKRRVLRGVRLRGLSRTHPRVVRRELVVRVGRPLTRAELRESVRRLRNLGVFRRVDVHVDSDAVGAVVTLDFDEKWTLLPIFSLGRGGGRLFLQAGAQDTHVAGRLFQAQAYWWTFAGTHSAVIALTDPRLFHRRLRATVVVEHGNRNRVMYGSRGRVSGGWSRHRDRVTLAFADLRRPAVPWGVDVHALRDRFTTSLLSDAVRAARGPSDPLPRPGAWLVASLWGRVGRIDRDDYLERGALSELRLSRGQPVAWASPASPAWSRVTLSAKWAWLGPARLNIALRGRVAAQTASHPEHRLYVGGLTAVRGYWEGRFSGTRTATLNAEARIPSWHGRWLALQHVVFVDGGWAGRPEQAAERAGELGDSDAWGVPGGGWSLGTGLRVILPLVARFVARVDVAWAMRDQDWRVSFGAQQFF